MSDECLEKLLRSKKYRDVCPDTVRRIWGECQSRYRRPKDAERAAREALHGITGAFLTPAEASDCAKAVAAWAGAQNDARLEDILKRHASTRERLPLESMDALYARIFEVTGRPGRVLDLACGIQPVYLGARGMAAVGVDISGTAVDLVNAFGRDCGLPVSAVCADLLCGGVPPERFDAALLFKALPLLERQRSGAAAAVMGAVNARFIVASFPTRTLGGRNVGMAVHYARWMAAHMPDGRETAGQFETDSELFYILKEK